MYNGRLIISLWSSELYADIFFVDIWCSRPGIYWCKSRYHWFWCFHSKLWVASWWLSRSLICQARVQSLANAFVQLTIVHWTFLASFGLILNHKNRDTEHGESFHQVVFTFYLTRLPLFYILNIIIPIILMFALSIGVFYLPVDSGEKMTLSISILLGQTVFLFLGRF